jgi:hypothetical protein
LQFKPKFAELKSSPNAKTGETIQPEITFSFE